MTDLSLGSFRTLTPALSLGGYVAFVCALALTVFLQRVQLELRREEASIWWASNGRDLINAGSLAALMLGLWAMGFPWPSAFLLGATVLLVLLLLEGVLLRWPNLPAPTVLSMLAGFGVASPLLVAPARVHALATALAQGLFR